MKLSKSYYYILLFALGFCITLSVPYLVQVATYTPQKYPLVLYSSQLKDLVRIDYSDKEYPLTDKKGNRYTTEEFDSLMPLLNYKQLIADNKMPDSIHWMRTDMRMIVSYQISANISAEQVNGPKSMGYPIFESLPKRINEYATDYVFCLNEDLEIYNIATNYYDIEKTNLFKNELLKNKYVFPAKWVIGNTDPHKTYDDGYFTLDAEGKLFHIKCVNGKPFVRNTHLQNSSGWHSFHPYGALRHNIYGILLSNDGRLARVTLDANGAYYAQWLDMPNIDPDNNTIKILGNIIAWNVTVSKPDGQYTYALNAWSLAMLASDFIPAQECTWDKINKWIFPLVIQLKQPGSSYVSPKLVSVNFDAIWFNIILTFAYLIRKRRYGSPIKWYALMSIIVFGIGAFMAMAFLPKNDVR